MELTGIVVGDETKLIIENDLTGIGWKIEDFKIMAYNMAEAQVNTFVGRLSMHSGLDPNFALFERNDVLGIATYGGGANDTLLDEVTVIVDELYISNITQSAAIGDRRINYQIILGLYDITDQEQLVAQVKKSQSD